MGDPDRDLDDPIDWLANDAACVVLHGAVPRRWTAGALRREAAGAAAALADAGVTEGDLVALCATRPEALLRGLLGAWRLGAVALPIDGRLGDGERRRRLEGAVVAVVDEPAGTSSVREIALGECPRESLAGSWAAPGSREALRLFTSGTTGHAKAARLSHGALAASARAASTRLGLRPDDRWLAPIPLFHVGGLSVIFRALLGGATAIALDPGADPWVVAEDAGATLVSLVATQLVRRLDSADRGPTTALRGALVGGGPVSPALRRRAREAGWTLAVTYGLTEAASQVTCTRWGDEGADAGAALDGVAVRVVDPDAEGVGEIEVGGATMMHGYAGGDDLRGWFPTGDLGRLDRRGRLTPVARRTDLIVSGGENIYPAEVEAALLGDSRIAEVCVVGTDDPEWGQRVVAVIVERCQTDDDSIRQRLDGGLARFKWPRGIVRVERLPRTATGKIARARVLEIVEGEGA